MKLTKLQIFGLAFATTLIIMTIVCTAVAYKYITTRYDYGKKDDKIITTFGKKEMTYYTGGMMSSTKEYNIGKYPEDSQRKIYFDAQLKPDNTIWLINLRYDEKSYDTWNKNGNPSLAVILESSTLVENGKDLQFMFNTALDSTYYYSKQEGSKYKLDRYVQYAKDGNRIAYLYEHLVTINDKGKLIRYLKVTTPSDDIGTEVGGVEHYFMYNDLVQVRIYYRKKHLKNWQSIENSMIAYIDQLYKEAEDETIN